MNIYRLILLFKSRNNIKLERSAVVTHDIPSNWVVGGVPAIIIKDIKGSYIIIRSGKVIRDDDIESILTTNKAKFSIKRISVKFLDDITMKYTYDVLVNGYIINVNQEVERFGSIYDFETCFLL